MKMAFGLGFCIFQHMDCINLQPWLNTEEPVEVTTLDISRSTLILLLGETIALALLEGLGIAHPHSSNVKYVPPAITHILHECIATHLTGKLATLHAQAKAMEYLCALADFITHPSDFRTEPCKTSIIRQLHEELTNWRGEEATLGELAIRYGLSARVMNDEFKREYGRTICAFVADQKLQTALAALSCGKRPLKVIAAQLGFSHVNHFINAFTRKFGYSPGRMRKVTEKPD